MTAEVIRTPSFVQLMFPRRAIALPRNSPELRRIGDRIGLAGRTDLVQE
jgi:hypothetical protein